MPYKCEWRVDPYSFVRDSDDNVVPPSKPSLSLYRIDDPFDLLPHAPNSEVSSIELAHLLLCIYFEMPAISYCSGNILFKDDCFGSGPGFYFL